MKKKENVKNVETSVIKDINEDTGEVKKFVFILIGVALVAIILYFVSAKYLVKDKFQDDKEDTIAEETISYTSVDGGNVFNRPYNEYYVFAYDSESLNASIYSSLLNTFDSKKGKIYFMNLSAKINEKYVGEKGNKDAKKPSELSLVEPTLIKIKDGKITKYIDTLEEIEKEIKDKA